MSKNVVTSRRIGLIALALSVGLMTACSNVGTAPSASPTSTDTTAALVAAAQSEGTLVVYTSAAQDAAQKQVDAFMQKYPGIDVKMTRLAGSQLEPRFAAESQSGQPGADVIVPSNLAFIKAQLDNNSLTALDGANIPGYPWEYPTNFLAPEVGSAIALIQPSGISYNTDLVKGDDIPMTYEALLNPKFKGKIGAIDPTGNSGQIAIWSFIQGTQSADFAAKFAAQEPKLYPAGATASAALGAGEVAVIVPVLAANLQSIKDKGAPVDTAVPSVTTGTSVYMGLVTKAQHPNAARLFVTFCLSKEGAQILADASASMSPYDTSKLPSGYTSLTLEDLAKAPQELGSVQKLLGIE